MRNWFMSLTVAFVLIFVVSSLAPAQTRQPTRQAGANAAASGPFDPRDLSGVWYRRGGDRTLSRDIPTMTPEGQAMFNANKPARGRDLGEPLNGEHPGFVRAIVPALSNDNMMQCNPQGVPRLILDPEPVEFIHLNGRLMQFFQWGRVIREIWMDGRELPSGENLANIGPSWFGLTVGKWEADTLVVNTIGLDDRTWLDIYGFPHSTEMRLEERYRRINADTIELRMTVYDPKVYTRPWVSDTKTFNRMPKEDLTFYGWYGFSGLLEGICAPLDEVETFNKTVRDPAGLGIRK